MTVLVTGATGNAGRAVVEACLARALPAWAAVRGGRREGRSEVAVFPLAAPLRRR